MPEVVLVLYGGCYGILYLPGGLLILWGVGTIVNQSLEGLPVFVLEHHFQLPPASFCDISFFGIDVKSLQEVDSPGVESLPVL